MRSGGGNAPNLLLYRHKDKPFHIDYVFVPKTWRLGAVEVGSFQEWGISATIHMSSMGQAFPADSLSFAASIARIRRGIARSGPMVKITYSNSQPLLRR